MNRFKCLNCGNPEGIALGFCEKCTPKEYFILKGKIENEIKLTKEKFKEEYSEIFKSLELLEQFYINQKIVSLKSKLEKFKSRILSKSKIGGSYGKIMD